MKSFEVTVSKDGEVEIKAVGYRGASCEKATEALEQAMGVVKKRSKTPDYYQAIVGNQKVGG